ncbi:Zn(II)2Cys6 transcription factor [Lipomyces starkeyi]
MQAQIGLRPLSMEVESRPILGKPAPYGQACIDCAKAKCKCIVRRDGSGCERCHRLGNQCAPSEAHRKRKPKRHPTSRTAKLEEKLDGIVSLLRAAGQPIPISVTTDHGPIAATELETSPNGDSSYGKIREDPIGNTNSHASYSAMFTPATSRPETILVGSPASSTSSDFDPSLIEAEEFLFHFRTQKSKYAPFVHIPSTMTAQQLRQERPFLWLGIMSVSSKSVPQQLALRARMRAILAQRMMLELGKDLDLLLGILIYLSWANYQLPQRLSLCLFMQLANSLVFDLGLNRSHAYDHLTPFGPHLCPSVPTSGPRTMEERRAVLGCYYLSSMISINLKRIDSLRWTTHMDDCLTVLAEHPECELDRILVQQVRCQLIKEKASQLERLDEDFGDAENFEGPKSFYRKGLQSRLEETKRDISLQSHQNEVMLLHLYSTELTINESEISKEPSPFNTPNFQRIERLQACLSSIRSWFDTLFKLSLSEYFAFSFLTFSQLFHTTILLFRISTLDDPSWDKAAARKVIDPLFVIDQVADSMAKVAETLGLENDLVERNMFTIYSEVMRSMKKGWEGKLAESSKPEGSSKQQRTSEIPETLPIDFSDDLWFRDILNSWES